VLGIAKYKLPVYLLVANHLTVGSIGWQ